MKSVFFVASFINLMFFGIGEVDFKLWGRVVQ